MSGTAGAWDELQRAESLARGSLATRMTQAADTATELADQAACRKAARCALDINRVLGGPEP